MIIDYSLYLVTDSKMCAPKGVPAVVKSLIPHGISCVQLRMKNASTTTLLETGYALKTLLKTYPIKLIINDHIDIAKQLDADGVHLGQDDASIDEARATLGPEKILGLSLENLQQAKYFANTDVDYFGVGPVFSTTTKADAAPVIGVDALHDFRHLINKPLVAIGGIHHKNINNVLKTGVDGVAVVSAILAHASPTQACAALHRTIRKYQRGE
jgi:thiamine-phosphate pyrophosphorylase